MVACYSEGEDQWGPGAVQTSRVAETSYYRNEEQNMQRSRYATVQQATRLRVVRWKLFLEVSPAASSGCHKSSTLLIEYDT